MTLVISNNCTFQKTWPNTSKNQKGNISKKIFATSKAIWKVVLQDSFGVWCWFYPQPRKKTPSHHRLLIFELRNTNSSLREHYTRSLGRSFFFFSVLHGVFFYIGALPFAISLNIFAGFSVFFLFTAGDMLKIHFCLVLNPTFSHFSQVIMKWKDPPCWHFSTTEKAPFFQRVHSLRCYNDNQLFSSRNSAHVDSERCGAKSAKQFFESATQDFREGFFGRKMDQQFSGTMGHDLHLFGVSMGYMDDGVIQHGRWCCRSCLTETEGKVRKNENQVLPLKKQDGLIEVCQVSDFCTQILSLTFQCSFQLNLISPIKHGGLEVFVHSNLLRSDWTNS